MSRANFVQVQLAAAATDIQTTLSVKAPVGGFVLPPADGGRLVLTDSPGRPLAFEVVSYTSRTGTGPYTLNGVTRGLEGTVGLAWGIDTFVMQSLTAGELDEIITGREPAFAAGTTAQYRRGDKTWQDLATAVRAAVMTGLSTATATAVAATDTLLAAVGKLQAQITGLSTSKLDATANAVSATKLQTARTVALSGDVTGSTTFDGTANVTITASFKDSGVAAGTYSKVTVDAKGNVTAGSALLASDVPTLNQSTTGNAATATKLATARTIAVAGAAEGSATFDGSGNATINTTTPRISPAADPTSTFRATVFGGQVDMVKVLRTSVGGFENFPQYGPCLAWSTSDTHAFFSPTFNTPKVRVGAGSSAGITWSKELAFTDSDITGNAATATKLETARTINGVPFDGTANITVADTNKLPLAGGTMTGQITREAGAVQSSTDRWTVSGVLRWQMGREADGNTFQLWHYNTSGAYVRAFSFNGSTGVISAAGFAGSAANLTGIPAAQLSGVVPDANLSGSYTGVSITGNAGTATALQTARTINGVPFNGSANITIEDATKLPTTGGSLTGVLRVIDGTAAAPGLTFAADTDTGIYRVGTNALGITTGGSVAVDFDAVGNTNVYGRLRSAGNLSSAAWTTTGCSFDLAAATFTDTSSAAAAVVATRAAATVNTPTFASTNAITVTNAATFYVAGRPTAGTNTTITSGWAVWVNSGDSRFGGNITATANITAYSDIRLKTDIEVIPDALNKVLSLRGVTYERTDSGERQTGVIAQEVQAVLPEAVIQGGEYLSVAYGNMVGLLIEAVKELKAEVDALRRTA